MFIDISLIIFLGYTLGFIFRKIKLPHIIGMILAGAILSHFKLLSLEILSLSDVIRKTALVIILIRAGLALKTKDLKEVGLPAILLSFIPAIFEITIITLLAPIFFNMTYLESGILGTIIAGVSPAIIVPKMLKIMSEKYGTNKKIPQLILGSSSVDDIFVLSVFFVLITIHTKGVGVNAGLVFSVIGSIILGVIIGILLGKTIIKFFKLFKVKGIFKTITLFTLSIFLVGIFKKLEDILLISDLITIMVISITILNEDKEISKQLSNDFLNLWIIAENFLFVLVGVTVKVEYILLAGKLAILLVIISLTFRSIGTYISIMPKVGQGKLNKKEKLMCIISYLPKATVQAGIGSVPLSLGVGNGEMILAISVIYIIITAPLGSFLIEKNYKKLLKKC